MLRLLSLFTLLVYGTLTEAVAQEVPGETPTCSYLECGLGLSPSLMSLDVVQGADSRTVARLGFFWSGNLGPIFAQSDSAQAYADRAVRTRRVAAAFTDSGIILLGIAAALIAPRQEVSRASAAIATSGAALLAASYPIQLRADAHLSRAVWWYNSHFAR